MRRIGTQFKLTDEEKARLIEDLNFWRNKSQEYYDRRDRLEQSLNCEWEGQDPSGLVLDSDEEAAWPFHGASDQRVRLGDEAFQEFDALISVALAAATVEISAGSGEDSERKAASLQVLLKWMLDNLGAKGWAQIQAALHYMLCDSPAVAALNVDWNSTSAMIVRHTNAEEVITEYAAMMTAQGLMSEAEAVEYARNRISGVQEDVQMSDGSMPDDAPVTLEDFLVNNMGANEEDAEEIVSALGEDDGEVEFAAKGPADEGISIDAMRYGDDFCIPVMCNDFDHASPWYRGEWLTETQLREKIQSDGWDERWVEETLGYGGRAFYNLDGQVIDEDYKNLYNICWCYTCETDDYGVTARYVTVIGHAEGSAFGKRMIKSRRGKWNTVLFRREVRSTDVLDCRGLAEICSSDQGIIKTMGDRCNDNALVSSLPPIVGKGTRSSRVTVAPFEYNEVGINSDIKFMNPPAFPATARDRMAEIRDRLWNYLGLPTEKNPATTRIKKTVADMLLQFRDLFVIMLEVAQDYASDEILAGVTSDGDVKGLKREDITGRFGVKLILDPDNIDGEKFNKKLTTFSQILSMDKRGEVDTSPVLRQALWMMFPEVSKRLIKAPNVLKAEDLKDEQENFVKIKAGVMPEMNTEGGWNYEARLNFYRQMQQENPEALQTMSPKAAEMLQNWIAALEQQARQFGENAEIGKTGVKGVSAE